MYALVCHNIHVGQRTIAEESAPLQLPPAGSLCNLPIPLDGSFSIYFYIFFDCLLGLDFFVLLFEQSHYNSGWPRTHHVD